MTDTPKPGSNEALEMGCTCPVMDNAHGRGFRGNPDHFVYNKMCPIHDVDAGLPMAEDVRGILAP